MYARLILLRHGQSIYNQKGLFTGWTDVALSEQGKTEAKEAGRLLHRQGIYPDICYTSWLKRAIDTAQIVLKEMGWEQIDARRSWRLNERHYGAWQEQSKVRIEEELGKEKFLAVRRGYDTPPPPLKEGDARLCEKQRIYQSIDKSLLPRSESLAQTRARVLPYYREMILPALAEGQTVFVSAHGNSLRALLMEIENLDEKEIVSVEIPTAVPLLYDFDETLQLLSKTVLEKNRRG